jgi:dihydroorotate dehydrogenase (fumarate)
MLNPDIKFINASGCWASNEEQIDKLFDTKLNYIVSKTCTLYPKKGHDEPTYYKVDKVDNIHINSKGLPNEGYFYYKNLYSKYSSRNKQFILSVAWEHNEKNTLKLLKDYDNFVSKQELVELNLSCPNLNHEIPSYNDVLLDKILKLINNLNLNNLIFSLKLSPFLDHQLCNKIIDVINNYTTNKYFKILRYIVLSNSIPNCLILQNNESVLSNIYGGLSGKLNKFISLSNIHYFKDKIDKSIQLIGCGGIENIQDVNDYLNNGATYVQLGSCFYNLELNSLDNNKINSLITQYEDYKNTLI